MSQADRFPPGARAATVNAARPWRPRALPAWWDSSGLPANESLDRHDRRQFSQGSQSRMAMLQRAGPRSADVVESTDIPAGSPPDYVILRNSNLPLMPSDSCKWAVDVGPMRK